MATVIQSKQPATMSQNQPALHHGRPIWLTHTPRGNGMTFGSLAARVLLEHWRGERSADQRLFRFSRLR